MDTSKSREVFEAWVLREYPNQIMGRFNNGEYYSTTVQHCWLAWQASRQELVVELPGVHADAYDPLADADYQARCREVITAQGLKVKP